MLGLRDSHSMRMRQKIASRIVLFGLILAIVSAGFACAESDDFDFKPRTDPARCQTACG